MPTQEERLETLEYGLKQYKTETIKAYGEIQMGFDAHTALLNEHTRVLDEHTRVLSEHTTRFDRLETLLTQILIRLPEKP
jgi:hypothetical protein